MSSKSSGSLPRISRGALGHALEELTHANAIKTPGRHVAFTKPFSLYLERVGPAQRRIVVAFIRSDGPDVGLQIGFHSQQWPAISELLLRSLTKRTRAAV